MFCEVRIFSLQLGTSPYLWKRERGGGGGGGGGGGQRGNEGICDFVRTGTGVDIKHYNL
jgi:hypothetical protein